GARAGGSGGRPAPGRCQRQCIHAGHRQACPAVVPRIPAMRSPLARGLVALAAVVVVVVLFVVLAGGDDDSSDNTTTTQTQAATGATGASGASGETGASGASGENQSQSPTPSVETIVVVNGKPRGGVQKLDYKKGDRIQFVVASDVSDEIHVHGYDIKKDVTAGDTVRFSFPASIEGVFEVELEGRRQQIAQLKVNPG